MKLRNLIPLILFMILGSHVFAQDPLYVSGQVTASETGLPISQHEVSVGLVIGQPLFTDFTDENGYYLTMIPPAIFDTTTILYVWVIDCNQEIQFHPFVANPNLFFDLDFSICSLNNDCQADFLVHYDGAHELLVYFYNQSIPVGNSTRWYWDFGDGMTSGDFEPMHNYNQAGNYTVCLTMVDSTISCTSSFCTEIIVGNNPGDCQAMFSWVSQGLTAAFTDQSIGLPDTYLWDFGDGTLSNEPNPVHTWVTTGTYLVCLNISDSNTFCESTFCELVTFVDSVQVCQAAFSYSLFHSPICEFTNLSTGQPDQVIWDFGDGTTSNEYNPIHVWEFPGVYTVCLNIYNSITQCGSTYCENILFGDTLPSCHAAYTYEQTGDLTFAFTNNSTGMIDQVIWDFGDGSPFSHEYNTEHTWEQPGIYHVCMAIISNYTGCQDVMCLDITVGDTISGCQADFSVIIESIPGNINHYFFNDESTGPNITNWYWDFGDGTISFIQNPDHTYTNSGAYQVCLTVSGEGNGGYCSSTTCYTYTTPAYYNLGGQVFAGNFPINNPSNTGDTALVRLYRNEGNLLSEVASGTFYEYGYFFFVDVLEGNYVVHAELTPGSVSYKSYLPAYTGETPNWQQSQFISLNTSDIFDANVFMPELSQISSGPGTISGNINCIENTFVDLARRIVFLKQSGNIISYTNTDENGAFIFTDLALGTYSLTAEIAGMYSQTLEVNLTEYGNQALNNQLLISSSNITGQEDHPYEAFPEVTLYPNPASGNVYLKFSMANAANLTSEIYSASGSVCIRNNHHCSVGINNLTLNTGNLSQGIYLLVLKSEDNQVLKTIKFAKR